ncbi:MAG: hypothetical protein QOG50_3137, partial [Actinomycetota bacterium]|nr:hypothetical protein [Actinomycetota bacterium]
PTAGVPTPDPVWASWPPTQPTPTSSNPTSSNPTPSNPTPSNPTPSNPTAPNPTIANPTPPHPYAPVADAGSGGAWGPPPSGWGPTGPSGWSPAPPASRGTSKPRRGLAVLAALALVLASAGVGAGVAIAVHDNSSTKTFDTSGGTSGNPNNSPFGNGGLGGNLPGNGNPAIPPGTGSLDMSAIQAKIDPALVNINTTLAQGRAAGSGMLISSTGEILTNNHVIADATSIKVVIGGVGASHDAKVVGYDVTEDVALLQIVDKVSNLPTVTFGEPSKVHIGDPVVAIGNALGRGGKPSASQGQVTALDQQVTAGDNAGQSETLQGMIQINAPIQPGDSGGALVDANAHIIGMNTAAAGGGRFNAQASNIGFAIPIDNAVSIVSQIRTGVDTDKVHIGDRALLGVQVQDVTGQNAPVSAGAFVVGVQNDTGASAVGLQAGDVLVSLNGKPIADQQALRNALYPFHPGESVSVGWVDSSGARHNADIKLIVGPPL